MSSLHLDWCSRKAVVHACTNWHYSKTVPSGKLIPFGVWEDKSFRGVVIFSRGAGPQIGCPYDLKQTQVVELTRVAMQGHTTAVSRIVAIALRILRKTNPGLRLVVSYADSAQGHIGAIYQAGNWVYVGPSVAQHFILNGRVTHSKSVKSKYEKIRRRLLPLWKAGDKKARLILWLRKHVDPNAEIVKTPPKYKYLMPLDEAMRAQIEPLRKPHPKRDDGACASEA